MPETLNGSALLADQESAIQFKEAKGYRLKSLKASEGTPLMNEAEFDQLPIGEVPEQLNLVLDKVPKGQKQVWAGKIYVKGELKKAAAYRGEVE